MSLDIIISDEGADNHHDENCLPLVAGEEDSYRHMHGTANFIASYFPMPQAELEAASGDPTGSSSATTTIDIDIDPLSAALSSMSASNGPSDPGGSVSPLSPVSAITMSALDLNQNSSSSRDQNVNINAGATGNVGQAQEGVGQSMFSLYGNGGRTKSGNNTANLGLGGLGGGLGSTAGLGLGTNMDTIQSALSGAGGEGQSTSSAGSVTQQIMLEQFRLAQLQQLQHLQAQIFQQQLALINSGALVQGVNSGSENSNAGEQSQNSSGQNRQSNSFHGLPTPGSSAELRASAPPLEFVSPMLLNYVANEMNNASSSSHHQNHNSYDPTTSPHPQSTSSTHDGHRHPHPHPHHHQQAQSTHSHSHSHSNPHSLTQTPVFGAQQDDNDNATNMMLDGLAPLTGRFVGTSHDNNNDHGSFHHRGTSSAPAHIAFSRPHTQNENDFDISPLTSPWLGAQGSGSVGDGRSRIHAYSHHHPHGHQQQQQQQQQSEWNPTPTPTGNKRTGSPMEEHARKSRQSPAIRATIPTEFSTGANAGGGAGRRNSRSSRSVNSTPLLKSSAAGTSGGRSRKDSLVASKPSPQSAGASSSGGNSTGGSVAHASGSAIGNSGGMGEMIQDSPSPVDLSLAMPPTNQDPSSNQSSANNASAASNSNASMFGVGLDGMNLGFDVGSFNFGGMGSSSGASRVYNSESMPPPLMPVTPASIMNLGRGMGGSNSNSGGHDVFNGFGGHSGEGMGRSTDVGGRLDLSILPSSSAPTSPNIDPTGPSGNGSTVTGSTPAGRKGKAKTAKEASAAAGTGAANGVSTRSKSAKKTAVTPSPNLKAILPASSASSSVNMLAPLSSPIITPTSSSTSTFPTTAVRKTSHKAAEQKRRDSLKTTFDDLRGLLPPIPLPSDTTDDIGGGGGFVAGVVAAARASMLPGALPPRGPPKAGGEGPNKGVSKLQLLICGNEYIRVLKARVERRDDEIEKLRREIRKLRMRDGEGMGGDYGFLGEGGGEVDEDGNEEPVDLEKDLDSVEWAVVRAQSGVTSEPILEEDEGEDG
ncbi:hypothetical protein PQX77_008858 [Marasmius sp. AFHP31]|nr:hypothetical protein PQX77_008858 [Marasmius sp. AFHP31]